MVALIFKKDQSEVKMENFDCRLNLESQFPGKFSFTSKSMTITYVIV